MTVAFRTADLVTMAHILTELRPVRSVSWLVIGLHVPKGV